MTDDEAWQAARAVNELGGWACEFCYRVMADTDPRGIVRYYAEQRGHLICRGCWTVGRHSQPNRLCWKPGTWTLNTTP